MTDEKGSPDVEGRSPTLAEFQRAPWDIRLFLELQEAMRTRGPAERAELWELRGPHEPDAHRAAELWCQAAEARLAANMAERGEDDLRRALAVDRGCARAASLLSQRLVASSRFAEAADVLEAEAATWGEPSREEAPSRARRHRELARLWQDHLGRVDLALTHWLAAWRLDPADTTAVDAARALYRSLGDDRKLIALYEEDLAHRRAGGDRARRARLEHELGQLRARRGELTQAIAHLEQALSLNPDEGKREQLAELYSRGTGDSNVWPTGESVGRAVTLFLELAAGRKSAGDAEGSLAFLRRALGVNPRSPEALRTMEAELTALERWKDLERLWASRISAAADATHEIDVATLMRKRAELLGDRLGDREGAKAAWSELASREPPGGPASQKLRLLYTLDSNWAELISLAERELAEREAQPDDPEVTAPRPRVDSRAETDFEPGEVTENTAVTAPIGDRRVEELLSLATIAREHQGNREQAAEYLHRILSIDPNHPEALARYADHFRDKRDWRGLADLAEFAVEAAVQAGAEHAEIVRRLEELAVVAEQRQGDVERATAAWKRILSVEPGHVKAKDALRRLDSRARMWESLVTVLEKEAQGASGPKDRAEALKRIAQVYRERQVDPRRAIALYEEALSLLPEDGPTLKALADLYEREGDDAGVARVLRAQLDAEAVKLASQGGPPSKWPTATRIERLTTLRRLAGMYESRLHDMEGVVYASTATLEMLPGDRDALDRLERVLEKSSDVERLEQALIYRAEAATGPAERTKALRRLARIAEQRGDRQAAIERWESLLRSAPNAEEALAALATLYEEAGRWPDLATTLERLVVLGSQKETKPAANAAESRERAADIRRWARVVDGKLNDAPRAVKAWRQLLDVAPKDREALDALARRHEAMGAWRDLTDVMGKQVTLHAADERERAVAIALRRAKLLEDRLGAPAEAIAALEHLIGSVDPANAAAHVELRRLHVARGDFEAAIRIAEREVFLSPGTARLVEIGTLCRDYLRDARRALQAFERAAALAPDDESVLSETAELYAEVEEWERHAVTLEKLAARREGAEKQAMYLRIAHVVEERLGDARTAFRWYHAAHNLAPGPATLDEIRHAAERNELWENLAEVLEEERKAQSPRTDAKTRDEEIKRYVALCRELAKVTERRLADPMRTLSVLRDAAGVAPDDDTLYAEAERIAADAAKPSAWQAVLGLYNVWLDARTDAAGRILVHERRARVLDERLQDATAALDELVHAFALDPSPGGVRDGILRLAARTRRWESAVSVEMTLFHRETAPAAKVAAACRAAQLIEEKLGERIRAFRAYLIAFRLAPEDTEVGMQLWRLARVIGPYGEKDQTPKPEATVGAPKPAAVTPLGLSPAAIFGGKAAAAVAKVVESTKKRPDSTIPLTVEDLMDARPSKRRDQTIELRIEDLIIADDDARPTPGQIVRRLSARPPAAPPAAPHLRYQSAWEELAAAYEGLPAADLGARLRCLYQAAEVWERGAADLPRAFATLARALAAAPGDPEPKERLYRLAEDHHAWDTLAQLFGEAAERADRPEEIAAFLHEVAHIRVRQGRPREAEALYRQLLGMRPEDTTARERLEGIFRQEERWIDLAASLEERTDARLGVGVAVPEQDRPALLYELAAIYEDRLAKPYEAVGALERLQQLCPDDLDAIEKTAKIYEGVGRWARVVEALSRVAEHTEGTPRAREARRRVAQIYAQELELPERAIEAYEGMVSIWPDDADAYAALDKLLEQGGKWPELLEVLRRRAALAPEPAARGVLYQRRGRIALAKLDRTDDAVASLRHARALLPDDHTVGDELAQALARGGQARDAAQVLEELSQKSSGAPGDIAAWLIRAANLYLEELDDRDAAKRALDRVLARHPDHPSALAAMARVAQATDPRAFADARLREAAAVVDEAAKVAALLDAGHALRDRLGDTEGARDAFQRVLELEPANAEAIWAMASLVAEGGGITEAAALLERRLEEQLADDERAKLLTELAALAQRAEVPAAAERRLEEALDAKPDYLPAIIARADLYRAEGAFAELEDFLRRTLPTLEAADVDVRAELDRRLAEAYERLGRDDDAYVLLLEADKLHRNDLLTKLALGENRYRARRWREAALHLASLADHPEAPTRAADVAEGLGHAAQAEIRSLRPERAPALYERALELKPDHTAALHALAEIEMQRGNVARAAELLEREAAATAEPAERVRLFEALGDLQLVAFSDRARARSCFQAAVDAAAPLESCHVALLSKLHVEQQAAGDLAGAGRTGELMASFSADPRARAQTLLEAARAYRQAGDLARARQAAARAVEADFVDEDALLFSADLDLAAGDHESIASRLGRALGSLKENDLGPDPVRRADLWRRLGEARRSRGDTRNALVAFERAVGTAARSPGGLAARRAIAELHPEAPEVRLLQLADVVEHDPRPDEVRALARLYAWKGSDRVSEARHTHELATAMGAPLDAEDERFLAQLRRRELAPDQVYPAVLDENELTELTADADDAPWHEALVEVSGSIPLLWPDAAEVREKLGLIEVEKLPSRDDSPAIAIHAQVAKVLGAPATVLHTHPHPAEGGLVRDVRIVCASPPLVVFGPRVLFGGRPSVIEAAPTVTDAELRFVLGRAAGSVRPGRVLALGLPPATFSLLCAGLAKAFAAVLLPGFAADVVDAEAERLRRTLPVKSRLRVEAALRGSTVETLPPARYRAASERAADRAGLIACGDIGVAIRLAGAAEHLIRLAATPAHRAALKKLGF